jgi:hypothetical protein
MAAFQYRIDGLSIEGDEVTIRLTEGEPPLAPSWLGLTQHTSRQAILESLDLTEEHLKRFLRDAILVLWHQEDPTLTNPELVAGKTATMHFRRHGLSVTVQ